MSRKLDEQLSALMDGDLSSDQLRFVLRRCADDARIGECWNRYHMARHALRREEVFFAHAGFAQSVMAAVANEPVRRNQAARWIRRGSGGAIAAAVAAAALLVTQPSEPEQASVAAMQPSAQDSVVQSAGTPVALATSSMHGGARQLQLLDQPVPVQQASARASATTQGPLLDARMQRYLIGHYEAAGSQAGQSGFVPYMLLVPAPGQDGRSATEHAPRH